MITFCIPGKIQPKQRPRKGINGFYTPVETLKYERIVATYAKIAMIEKQVLITDLPGCILIDFRFKPSKISAKKIKDNPLLPALNVKDIDNCIKSVLDGLNGILYYDDRQIVQIFCRKLYAIDTEECTIVNFQSAVSF